MVLIKSIQEFKKTTYDQCKYLKDKYSVDICFYYGCFTDELDDEVLTTAFFAMPDTHFSVFQDGLGMNAEDEKVNFFCNHCGTVIVSYENSERAISLIEELNTIINKR